MVIFQDVFFFDDFFIFLIFYDSSQPNGYLLIFFLLLFLGLKAAALMNQSVEKSAELKSTVEEGPLTEQQLGLQQAEERLYRDYIHRLLKVSRLGSNIWLSLY